MLTLFSCKKPSNYFPVGSQEREELHDLRNRVQRLEKENKNLQEDLQRLVRFKQNCLENHEQAHSDSKTKTRGDEEIFFQQLPDVKPKTELSEDQKNVKPLGNVKPKREALEHEQKYRSPFPPPATPTLYIDPTGRQFKREPRDSKSRKGEEEEAEIVILDDD